MRFSKRRLASLASLSLLALVWSGCEAKQQTEYVAGVSTQVKVPRDLTFIRLSVAVGGVRTFCRAYRVYDGRVQLPRSLGTFAQNDPKQSGVLTYQIIGYTKPLAEGDELDDFACADKVGETEGARILRRSRQPYVENEILFLPMPLKYSCYDTPCGDEQTCKGGTCVDATTDPSSLKKYSPDLVDGTGSTCFSLQQCLGAALPAIPVNVDDCTFAIPNTPSAPPTQQGFPNPFAAPPPDPGTADGVNVEITYDGGYVSEVLDKDPDEGFTLPDPTKPQRFRLAPGLCQMWKGTAPSGRRITAVRASPTCAPKTISQPICQGDAFTQMGLTPEGVASTSAETTGCTATELFPPRTGLVVVIDDTKEHASFYGGADVELAMKVALEDPAFYRAELGVVYTSGPLTCGPATSAAPFAMESAITAGRKIGDSIKAKKAAVEAKAEGTELPRFDEGLKKAYEALDAKDYFRRAVIAIGERDFDGAACAPAQTAIAQASARATGANPIATHVFNLAGGTSEPDDPTAETLAQAGGTGVAVIAEGTNKVPAIDRFREIVNTLATCVYVAPTNADALPTDGGTLSYNHPSFPQDVKTIAHDPACTEATVTTGKGWGRSGDKIYVCGSDCTTLRTTLKAGADLTLVFGQPPPPMPIFAHKKNCAPKKP